MVAQFPVARQNVEHVLVQGNPFLGRQMANGHQVGPMLADKIDAECQRIVTECYDEVVTMLKRDESCFRTIIDVLMEKETILGPEFVELRNKTLCAVPQKAPADAPAGPAATGSADTVSKPADQAGEGAKGTDAS